MAYDPGLRYLQPFYLLGLILDNIQQIPHATRRGILEVKDLHHTLSKHYMVVRLPLGGHNYRGLASFCYHLVSHYQPILPVIQPLLQHRVKKPTHHTSLNYNRC